ncbi:hypothetical protein B566_EDAN004885 [Ephemera danica]|nr:hypothetical protein B566_EDAN004885 [Ephemera danica]
MKPKKFTIAQERALSMQRKMIESEMKNFNYRKHNCSSLDDLVPELGGTPIRSVLVTTWRSGSTFLGGILGSHPGDWHNYEPLLHMGIVQIRGSPLAIPAITTLQQLLQCKYDDLSDLLEYGKKDADVFQYNKRLWEHCQNSNNRDWLAVKMVLLVRDPRGTIQSRHHREWCPDRPDCDEPELLCADLKANYYSALKLIEKYPTRFRVIRYEDFSINPYNQTEKLFKFLNLDVHEEVYQYLNSHTKNKSGGEWSTFRNSKTAPFHWREDMDFKEVNKIQNVCADAMELWGYMPAHNASHMHTFNPLRPFYFHRNVS